MKRIRLRTVAVFAMAGVTGAILLHTSQSVQRAEDQLAALKNSILQEQDSIKLLKAEWAYLNNPERIENLSRQYLDLKTPSSDAITAQAADVPSSDALPPISPASGGAREAAGEGLAAPPKVKVQSVAFKPSLPQPSPAKPPSKDFNSLIQTLSKRGGG